MVFRALQQDPCPPSHRQHSTRAKFHTASLDTETSDSLAQLRQQALRTVTHKTGEKLTIRHVDKRLKSLQKAAQPGLAVRRLHREQRQPITTDDRQQPKTTQIGLDRWRCRIGRSWPAPLLSLPLPALKLVPFALVTFKESNLRAERGR